METSSKETKEVINIQELKEKLKRGDFTKIAKKLNVTPQCISSQFSDKPDKPLEVKPDVIKAALELIAERKKNTSQLNKKIKSA